MGILLGGQHWRKLYVSDLLTDSQEMPSQGGRINTDILARGAPRPGGCRYHCNLGILSRHVIGRRSIYTNLDTHSLRIAPCAI